MLTSGPRKLYCSYIVNISYGIVVKFVIFYCSSYFAFCILFYIYSNSERAKFFLGSSGF